MYYKVNPDDTFAIMLGRNTNTTQDVPHELKPQAFIPIKLLNPVKGDMFE